MQVSYTCVFILTMTAACGSGPSGPKNAPAPPPPPVARPVDAAVPDAAPPPRLACDPGTVPAAAPAPDPTWACVRPDGTRHGAFLTLFPDESIAIRGAYADDRLDGAWRRHRPDGSIAEEGAYQAGKKHGKWRQLGPGGDVLGAYELTDGTGVEKSWYEAGALYSERALQGGVAHGAFKVFAPDGVQVVAARYHQGKLDGTHAFGSRAMMRIEETFAGGVRRGERKIWLLGRLIAEERYDRRGRLDGAYVLWRYPGSPRAKGRFARGERTGPWTWWDRANRKEREGRYVDGKRDGTWTEWSEGKLTFTGRYTAGKPDGEFVAYDRAGRELGRFTMKAGTGTLLTFHGNQRPSSRQAMVDGVAAGIYQELTSQGKVVVEGRYRGGHKHGTWKAWTPGRTLVRVQTYKRGQLDGAVKKYVAGKLATSATYVAGKAHGPYAEYRDGAPALIGELVDDRRHGTWTTYDKDGQVVLTATYDRGVLHGPWRQLVDGAVLEGELAHGRRTGTWARTARGGGVSTVTYTAP